MAPVDFFQRLKAFYTRDHSKPPVISSIIAVAVSSLFIVLFVLPFYLSKTTRPSPSLSKDAPSVIKARIRAVTITCILCSLAVLYIITNIGNASLEEAFRLLGWWPIDPIPVIKVLLLCMAWFIGPLFDRGIAQGRWRSWIKGRDAVERLSSWTGWRNIVAAPIFEEVMFRSLLINLHLLAHWSPSKIVFLTPLYFGIAHVHHFYEALLTRPDLSVKTAAIISFVQFTYTSLFGFFEAFVFLRTGSLYAAIAAHMFCNWIGLPRFWGPVTLEMTSPTNPGKNDKTNHASRSGSRRVSRSLTVIYYVLLVLGAVLLYKLLRPLTDCSGALASFEVR